MATLRRAAFLLLAAVLLCALAPGCGGTDEDAAWRQEVDGCLRALEGSRSFRYRTHLETWIGVSGQSVYGDEKGEGAYRDGDFSVDITRTSPAGEESLAFVSRDGEYWLREGGAWSAADLSRAPNPLYDPARLGELLSSYGSLTLQGEEERSGVTCRRYLLRLGEDRARDTLTETAWSYFSSLRYELAATLWVSDASAPPAAVQVEVTGFDPQESLQRYRLIASVELVDFGSPDIRPASPGE